MKEENKLLVAQITEASEKQKALSQKLTHDINTFQENSKNKLNEMSQQILAESSESHTILADLTNKYEGVLKDQIKLLTENQRLSKLKEEEESSFKNRIDEISKQYEKRINDVEKSLKENMKRVSNLQGPGLIKILLKNERFREEIKKRGGNVENILMKTEQESLYKKINEKEEEIKQLEQSNEQIDEEVSKMSEMMLTFNQLLENMKAERVNLQ